ncbi:Mec3 protein [Saccharomycopsis crataegensis]|uniref:Mec3 protein n=1 Tax=Saccharomycopsis crataegensis TaxID=43959 RepID=A0AAV5QUV3_9ASCO|nr:Mec3 protein [Saccharomycopsis crataegensis]
MKLRITMSSVDQLRSTVSTLLALRKFCVLRFTPAYLQLISASISEPQVWAKIISEVFDSYECESIRDNLIVMEINAESLFTVLRNFERANSDVMVVKLQRKLANAIDDNGTINKGASAKRLASLTFSYNESINSSTGTATSVTHTVKIPIRLLRKESDERIIEPELHAIDLVLRLPPTIGALFRRAERFKKTRNVSVCGTNQGELSLMLDEDGLRVTSSWNEKLLVQRESTGEEAAGEKRDQNETGNIQDPTFDRGKITNSVTESDDEGSFISVDVRLKDWRNGLRFVENCRHVILILSASSAVVLHCSLDDTDEVEIIYYINAVTGDIEL